MPFGRFRNSRGWERRRRRKIVPVDVAQSAEASDLKSAQCGFESRRPHKSFRVYTAMGPCTIRQREEDGQTWYAAFTLNGKRKEISLRTFSVTVAVNRAKFLLPSMAGMRQSHSMKSMDYLPTQASYHRIFRTAKKRSKAAGTVFTITDEERDALIVRANGKCELSGVAFSLAKKDGWFRAPFSPSLDRIHASESYHASNVRLICVAMNWALQDWGESVFKALCLGYLGQRGDGIFDLPYENR